ncbi:hypothetical protein E4U41_002779 [Claviceps citrina]|nr:hypothetical protein E4U41_002779 [Claviceps citrina]
MSDENSTRHLLTLVITTSPTLSAPSTELLSTLISSIKVHCAPLLNCRVIVVLDACEQIATQPRLKKGYVTQRGAEDYVAYKENVKALFLEECLPNALDDDKTLTRDRGKAEYGSPGSNGVTPVAFTASSTACGRVTFIEAVDQRLGFGLAVRTALRMVKTPYTWIHQHDWALMYDIPIASLLAVMRASEKADSSRPPVRYICLPSGRRAPYATSDQVTRFPELRRLAEALTGDFSAADGDHVVPLTPMFFWHDKPHVASTSHYLGRVFPSRLAMMRGAFIEDTIGQKARDQMKEGAWAKWATWQFNPDEGKQPCLKHLHGRTWRGADEEQRIKEARRERNMAAAVHRAAGAVRGAVAVSGRQHEGLCVKTEKNDALASP